MNNQYFWEKRTKPSKRWLVSTTPSLYSFKLKNISFVLAISLMDLRKDLPLLIDWIHPSFPSNKWSIRYPETSDQRTFFEFYTKELSTRMRLFPFVIKEHENIFLFFDCLQDKRDKGKKSNPCAYVFFHYPPRNDFIEMKSYLLLMSPFVVDFLRRTMGCRTIFCIPNNQVVLIPFLRNSIHKTDIQPPSTNFPFWKIG